MHSLQASVPVQLQPADIEDRVIPGGPTGQVSIRIIRSAGLLPMVLYLHGGGWILSDKDTHEQLYRELANAAQAVVFRRLHPGPDAHYPGQNEQAYTALQWAVGNAAGIGADPRRKHGNPRSLTDWTIGARWPRRVPRSWF